MSALNIIVAAPDAVHVFSDAAGYNPATGEQLCYVQKLSLLAHLPCVLAARGSLGFVPALAEWCNSKFGTFDDLVSGLVETAKQVADVLAPTTMEIIAAGYSAARDRPEAYLLRSVDWTLQPIELALVTPADTELQARCVALGIDPTNPDHALALMNEQRARTWKLGDAGISAVGGWCQVASVTRDGVSSRVLERWC